MIVSVRNMSSPDIRPSIRGIAALSAGFAAVYGLSGDVAKGQGSYNEFTSAPSPITEFQPVVRRDPLSPVIVPPTHTIFENPSIEASPLLSPSGNSWAEYLATGPDQFEVLENIMTQDNSKIRTNITQPRLQRVIDRFWINNARELNDNSYRKPGDPHQFYSKRLVDRFVGYVGRKLLSRNDWPRYNAAQLVYVLGRIAGDHTYSLKLREEAAKKADVAYDAEVGQMPADQREQGRTDINRKIRGAIDFQLHPS